MSFIIKFFREFRIVYVDKVIIFCIVFFMVGISYIVIIIEWLIFWVWLFRVIFVSEVLIGRFNDFVVYIMIIVCFFKVDVCCFIILVNEVFIVFIFIILRVIYVMIMEWVILFEVIIN